MMEAFELLIESKMLSKEFAAMILQQFDQSALRVIQIYSKAKTNELIPVRRFN
jgi:hypothetical protein